jgi:uncharacterized protein Smg (DUF494 family)
MRQNSRVGEIDLRVLADRGYTQTEISTAFSWLFDKINLGEHIFLEEDATSSHSHRILHEVEKMVISPEAYGYLIQLREIGLVDEADIELIIDRVMISGFSKVSVDDMKTVVATVMFDFEDSERIGSRLMLNSRDTIN